MKKEELDNLEKQLEELEAEVERLKQQDPTEDFEELDKTIEKFRNMINDPKLKDIKKVIRRKRIIGTILGFVFHLIVTFCVLGFFVKFLDEKIKDYIIPFIFGLSLIVFIYRRLSKLLIFQGPLRNHKILYTVLLYFLFSVSIGLLDFFVLNFWTGIWECIISVITLGIVLDLGEFIYYRKLYAKYKR